MPKLKLADSYILAYPSGLYFAGPIGTDNFTRNKTKAMRFSRDSARYYASASRAHNSHCVAVPYISDHFDRYLALAEMARAKYASGGRINLGNPLCPSPYAKVMEYLFRRYCLAM